MLGAPKPASGAVMAMLAKRKRTKASIMRFFFDIKAKRTPSIVRKLFSKRSEHIRQNENYFRSEANTFDSKTAVFKAKANLSDSKKIIFEAKRTHQIVRKSFSKQSEHIRQKENYFRSKAKTLNNKKIIFEAKRTRSTVSKLFSK